MATKSSLDFAPGGTGFVRAAQGGIAHVACGGNLVVIDHDNDLHTSYYHMVDVPADIDNQLIGRGTIIGRPATDLASAVRGCRGSWSSPHVHFTLHRWSGPFTADNSSTQLGQVANDSFEVSLVNVDIGGWTVQDGGYRASCMLRLKTRVTSCPPTGLIINDGTIGSGDITAPSVSWARPVSNSGTYNVACCFLTLEATASDNVGVARVKFTRWDAVGQGWLDMATVTSSPWTYTFDAGTLNSGYNQVNVQAWDIAGNASSSPYIFLNKTTSTQNLPAAPSNVVVSNPTASALTVTFTDNATNETATNIERKTGTGGSWGGIGNYGAISGTGRYSYTDTGRAAGTTYCYRYQARNDAGSSAYSNEACGTTTGANNEVRVCEHTNLGGTCSSFSGDDPSFGNDPVGNDRASSLSVPSGRAAVLYEHINYGGAVECFGPGTHNIGPPVGNDRASSIRIFSSCAT